MIRGTAGAAALVVLIAAGCTRDASDPAPTMSAGLPPAVTVAAADFPSEWIARQVGGEAVAVRRIPAAQIPTADVDLIVYVPGLDTAVDRAVQPLQMNEVVNLVQDVSQVGRPGAPAVKDPYVWFDPVNVSTMGATLSSRLAQASERPFEASQYYGVRALKLQGEALQVDQRLQEVLNPCRIPTLVVQRPILTYLAKVYGFSQVTPDDWRPAKQPVTAVYYTPDASRTTAGIPAVTLNPLTRSAPRDDLLQGVLDTADTIASHQDCPLVTPQTSDRPG